MAPRHPLSARSPGSAPRRFRGSSFREQTLEERQAMLARWGEDLARREALERQPKGGQHAS